MGDKKKSKKGKKKVVIIVLVVLVVVAADHWKFSKENDKPGSNSSQYSRGGAGTEERFI